MADLSPSKSARLAAVALAATAVMVAGCERPSDTPPPGHARAAMEKVKQGYASEDMEVFCAGFADIMFTSGFTKQAYLDVVHGLKKKLGAWQSEAYLGEKKGTFTWRVTFSDGSAKLVLVLDDDAHVIGLWFR